MLAGGTGAARLAVGLQGLLQPGELSVIANTADDQEFWGLHVSPDTDSVLYRLAGLFNDESGFGVAGDTFALHGMMKRLGEVDWFWLGDRDLGVHVFRTERLRRGETLSEISLQLCERLGLATPVIPMSDQPVRTVFDTELGRLGFQEYFVRERLQPRLDGIRFEGLEEARPSPAAERALAAADLVLIGPSNPLISIAPILGVLGDLITAERTLAVTPIVGGRALKGPTVEMMRAMGIEATPVAVAREYAGRAAGFVLDEQDAADAPAIEGLGMRVLVTDTVMSDGGRRLAAALLEGV